MAALRTYGQPGREAGKALAGIARQAAELLPVPVALISLIGETWQEIVAAHGTDIRAIPRALSLCGHAIAAPGGCLVVPDLEADARFRDHALAQSSGVRFYAGVCLLDADGYALGTLSAFASEPIAPEHNRIDGLRRLAMDAMGILARQRDRHTVWRAEPATATVEPHDALPPSPPCWLGVRTEYTSAPHTPHEGRRLIGVAPGSPAQRAGLRPGDIIVAVGGRPMRRRRDLMTAIARFVPGETVEVQLWRDGALSDHAVLLAPKPARHAARPTW